MEPPGDVRALFPELIEAAKAHKAGMNAVHAMGAGVIQDDRLFRVKPAGQLKVVDGARDVEPLPARQRDRMEGETQAFQEPAVSLGQSIARRCTIR